MNKICSLLFLIFVLSCGIGGKNINNKKNKNIQLYTMVYSINADSLLVKASISFPISNLVFIKDDNQFKAAIEANIRLENDNTGNQIKRYSNTNEIIKQYYEDTKSLDSYQIDYEFYLLKDNYKIFAGIKDLDSFNNWNIIGNIDSSNQKLSVFVNKKNQKKYITDKKFNPDNKLWIELPKHLFDSHRYKYTIINGTEATNSTVFEGCIDNQKLLFECPIEIPEYMFGDVQIKIISDIDDTNSIYLNIEKNSSLWSSDINSVLGVMAYILPYSEIRSLYSLNEEEQLEFVINYMDGKDLDSKTNKNEFLELIKIRFQYANNNFSEYNIGWKTNRGEIYIVNGPPKSIEAFYDNDKMVNKQIWYYENKTFIFSDERTFGELKLISF